jgi:hypothetical protein
MTTTSLHVLHAPVADFLTRISLAEPQARAPMTLWPLVLREAASAPASPPYIALADALAKQTLRVDEVGDAGTVPHIRVSNAGDVAVLVLFGEELRGAKQNRIANASFLVGACTDTVIDVSCVEAGRWSRERNAPFAASREVVSNLMRKKMAGQVSSSRRMGRGFSADQHMVWDDVSARLSHSGSRSRTSAYSAYAEQRREQVGALASAFHPVAGQVGFVCAIDGEIAGLEVVGRAEVFARIFPALLNAYAIDAVDLAFTKAQDRARLGRRCFDAPEPFLRALAAAPSRGSASLGLGEDLRIEGEGVAGCALVAGDVVHLTAFAAEGA